MKTGRAERRRANLKRLLGPRHIAFIGGRAVEPCIAAARKSGFDGQLWVVHPSYETLAGLSCYRSLADLPEAPDASLIAVSRERAIAVVSELSAIEAGGAVMIGGEFAEAGTEGEALQARLVEAAGDLALVGPNCLGVMNQFDGAAIWGGDNVFEAVAGDGVALVSQSGYVAYSITNVEQAFPLGYAISMGNQAVLSAGDYIDVLLDDSRVRAIGLYLEGIVDIAGFSEAALRALEQGIPLVALRAGGTRDTAELTRSHSGTLAVDNQVWSALFRRLGIVEAGSPKALVETLKILAAAKPPLGARIVAAANSGGYAAVIGEKGRELGLDFPTPSEAQCEALRSAVPDLVSLHNPLDWNLPWSSMMTPDTSETGMGILIDARCDLLVYFIDWPRQQDVAEVWWPTLEGLIRLNETSRCPVVIASVLPDGMPAELRLRLAEAGVVTLQGLDDALTTISAAARYPQLRASILVDLESRRLPVPMTATGKLKTLNELEGKTRLAEYGVTIPENISGSAEWLLEQARDLPYPLAVKLLNAELAHKNHAGAVHLDIRDAAELAEAIDSIQSSVAAWDASLKTDQFLAERMVESPRAEFIAGISRKTGIGHALIIGHGGTAVETLRDFATLLLPASSNQIHMALTSLDISHRLQLTHTEIQTVTETITRISEFASDHCDRLEELDVNPLILDATGRVTAVDTFMRLSI